MATENDVADHQIWILPLKWFVEENERAKAELRADLVALAQMAQAGGKVVKQIRLLGVLGDAYIKQARDGRRYLIFKGVARMRPNLPGTRYLVENPKVACFVVGTTDILKDAAKGTRVAVIAFVAIDVMKEIMADRFSWASLGVNVGSDIAQAVLATGVGIVAGVIATTVGAPAVVAFAIVVGVGFGAGMLLTSLDGKFNLTDRLRARMMALERDPTSALYKVEYAASNVSMRVASFARQSVAATQYETDRAWHSIEHMLSFDRTQTRSVAAPFRR